MYVFGKKANEGVSEEKHEQLRDMSVSYQVYTSKVHKRKI